MLPDPALDARRRPLRRPRGAASTVPVVVVALLAAALLAALLATAGCGRTESYGDDEHPPTDRAIDVPSPIEVSIEDDIQEPPRRPQLTGVLPGDFPPDLPVHLPSSIVDFGPGEVELMSASAPAEVRASLRAKLEANGWSVGSDGAGGLQLNKGGRSASVSIAGGQGTTYRYRY